MSDDIENRIAKLEQELAELKAEKAKPAKPANAAVKDFVMPRYDPTENFGMPASAVKAMVDAVPDLLMRSIVGDNRKGVSDPGWLPEKKADPEKVRGSGCSAGDHRRLETVVAGTSGKAASWTTGCSGIVETAAES